MWYILELNVLNLNIGSVIYLIFQLNISRVEREY
jgi:hypothetical protein